MKRLLSQEKNKQQPIPVKIVVVGDGTVGKTSLLLAYMKDIFFDTYEPTIYETTSKDISVNAYPKVPVTLTCEDTAGQETYEQFRFIQYANSRFDVILLCFSVDSQDSLTNITDKWIGELTQHCPGVPVILVGTKMDLRLEETIAAVDAETAKQVSQQIGALSYIECSAKSRVNVDQLFQAAAVTALKRKLKTKRFGCNIL